MPLMARLEGDEGARVAPRDFGKNGTEEAPVSVQYKI
jgi:hypothetical protein